MTLSVSFDLIQSMWWQIDLRRMQQYLINQPDKVDIGYLLVFFFYLEHGHSHPDLVQWLPPLPKRVN